MSIKPTNAVKSPFLSSVCNVLFHSYDHYQDQKDQYSPGPDPSFTFLSSLKGRGNMFSSRRSLCPCFKTPNRCLLLTGHSEGGLHHRRPRKKKKIKNVAGPQTELGIFLSKAGSAHDFLNSVLLLVNQTKKLQVICRSVIY